MTKFIFVRHGESIGNKTGRFLGNFDGELTELGRRQAERAAEYLQNEHIDAVYASDLCRAYETGRIIAEPHGLKPIPDPELREIHAGKWENEEFTKIEKLYHSDWIVWQQDIYNSRPTGGESVKELYERVNREVWRLAELHDDQTLLIATHATPIRMLMRYWSGTNETPARWVGNASLTAAEYDNASHEVKVLYVSENSYLAGLETNLPPNV